jgi:hypothetical protein
MSEKKGINELLEVLDLAECVTLKLLQASKDGFDPSDLRLLLDADLFARGKIAAQGLSQVAGEVEDIDLDEAGLLALRALKLVKSIREQMKMPAAPSAAVFNGA